MLDQVFTQTYKFSKGIKKFGDKVLNSTLEEVKQLQDRTCFRPIYVNNIKSQERKQAMESLIFLMENRGGRIKVRACTDASIQKNWMNK